MQGPLFDDGTFEFMCIPDGWGIGIHTYSMMVGRNGRPHLDYFPASRQQKMAYAPGGFSVFRSNRGLLSLRRQQISTYRFGPKQNTERIGTIFRSL
jgi:hypothetical protein